MRKLWVFGDSFSTLFDENNTNKDWRNEYMQWKGYRPKIYSEIISETLGIELKNMGKDASSNYDILNTFGECVKEILNEDIVIINWSEYYRWRVCEPEKWVTIGMWSLKHKHLLPNIDEINYKTYEEIMLHRYDDKVRYNYISELNSWINIINVALKNNVIFHWTPIIQPSYRAHILNTFERIKDEEKGEGYKYINEDIHFSEAGNIQLANWFLERLNTKKLL